MKNKLLNKMNFLKEINFLDKGEITFSKKVFANHNVMWSFPNGNEKMNFLGKIKFNNGGKFIFAARRKWKWKNKYGKSSIKSSFLLFWRAR